MKMMCKIKVTFGLLSSKAKLKNIGAPRWWVISEGRVESEREGDPWSVQYFNGKEENPYEIGGRKL